MQLIPMLEIEIPYQAGHYGNLPVMTDTVTVAQDTPIESWLDKDKTDSYAMSVRKKDDSGAILAYVPLVLMREYTDDNPVAFGAHLYYEPTSTDFGQAHKMRLVWMIKGLVAAPNCEPPTGESYDSYCSDTANWTTSEEIVHTYYDDWYLTGLSVQEEHGVEVGGGF